MALVQCESNILIDWFYFNKIQAHPDKFQAIAVGKPTFSRNPYFSIGNSIITCDKTVKLLGIDIDYQLNFDTYIQSICKKAVTQINVIYRPSSYKINKRLIVHTFVLSNVNFCPINWHFCSEGNINKIEKLQERALRFVYNDYRLSYCDLLEKSGLPSLHIRALEIWPLKRIQ